MENVWKKILAEVQLEVSAATFATLFKKTNLVSLDKNVATISCPSAILSNLIETRYYALLKKIVDRHLEQNASIIFTSSPAASGTRSKKPADNKHYGPLFSADLEDVAKKARLNPIFTFDNFAVSSTNQLAFAAGQAVAQKMAVSYNPLFIYGGVGVGKTHLMQAIGNQVLVKNPKTKAIYCMGEEFTNEIIFAIRNKTTRDFKDKFRNTQLLLVDDVQFIAGKETVQEEFFHTFNAIVNNGGQIILTSDKPPSEIRKLEKRLGSRFEGGLTVDIAAPDFELKTAIVLIKARIRGVDIPIDVAKILAENTYDTRGLEGSLIRLLTEAQATKAEISDVLAKKVVKIKPVNYRTNGITKDVLLEAICSFYEIRPAQLKSSKRNGVLVLPRHILMYLLRTELNTPLTQIGDFLGGRDHTTVLYGVEKIEKLIEASPKIKEEVVWIKNRLYQQQN